METIRIAMIGCRGVPATIGGVERHVEELGSRMSDLGHDVTIYCRDDYVSASARGGLLPPHRGMTRRTHRSVSTKYLDAISQSAIAAQDARRRDFDIVHLHALGPGLVTPLLRRRDGPGLVQTVHGLDHLRDKWGRVGRTTLRGGAWMSAHLPDATITVSRSLSTHYLTTYGQTVHCVPNGVRAEVAPGVEMLDDFGLEPGRYAVFVGRFVPEKAPDHLLAAFRRVPDASARLVLAGGSGFAAGYEARMRAAARTDPRVLMPGVVTGRSLHALYAHAAVFVLPSRLEGLPLTLLEALSFGTPVIATRIPPHVEVIGSPGDGAHLVDVDDTEGLAARLCQAFEDVPAQRSAARVRRERLLAAHSWDLATDRTLAVYEGVLGHPVKRQQPPAVPAPGPLIDLTGGAPSTSQPSRDLAGQR